MFDFEFYDNFFFPVGSMKKYNNKYNIIRKNWTGKKIFYNLLDYVVSRFEWNLPDTCDDRFLELCYITDNRAVFAKPKKMPGGLNVDDFDGVMNFRMLVNNQFTMFGYPTNAELADAMGRTYGTVKLSTPNSTAGAEGVLSLNSKCNTAPIYRIKWYAERLLELETAISVAINNTKASIVVKCSPEQKNAVMRSFQEAQDGAPIIITIDQQFNQGTDYDLIFSPQNTDVIKTLYEMRDKTYADFFHEFGISSNGVVNKMAGVSDMEIEQSAESISIRLKSELRLRKKACEQVKELFGVDMDVKIGFDRISDNNKEEEEVLDDEME